MAIYNVNGLTLSAANTVNGIAINSAYDVHGLQVHPAADYSNYTYSDVWTKNVSAAQGLAIKDNKVFWVSKSGDSTVPADMYVFNLSDGSQALSSAYITVYSGHGNNISFAASSNKLIATPAYQPSRIYVNEFDASYNMTLAKTLVLDDGSWNCDACYVEGNDNIVISLGHTAGSSDRSAPFRISVWDLTSLTNNGDGTFTPRNISSVDIPQPANTFYFQGCTHHDGLLWYASGYGGGSTAAYVYAIDVLSGETIITLDLETLDEPEGIAFYPDADSSTGYALYVGFAQMKLRKYVF